MLRGTPFYARTAALSQGQNWRNWSGYLAAGAYELSHDREYFAIRSAAALIDVSPLFKYVLRGPGAAPLLDRVMTRDIGRCAVGQVLYTPWCDEDGKVLDDGTVARLDADTFRVTAADPNLRWFQDNARGLNVSIEEVSEQLAALALQGPLARAILEQVAETTVPLAQLKYYHLTPGRVSGIPVTISRTGYTGDLGYELWVDAAHAAALWDALMLAGAPYGLMPAGILALDVARIEAGLLMIEVDYVSARKALIPAQKSTPYELGLGWAVQPDKPHLVGGAALRAEKRRGPAWQFVGLTVDWNALERLYTAVGLPMHLPATAWRTSVPIYAGGTQAGYATSGCWSPILKQYIVLAHLQSAYAAPERVLEMEVTVEHQRRRAAARVVKLPFFNPARKRAAAGKA